MTMTAAAPLPAADAGDAAKRSLLRRCLDFVFGYDFFVSYAWSDAKVYAPALARHLEADGFEVFLDRVGYGSGDNWKTVGAWTLRRTGELILVGSPAALQSDPVLREVEIFAGTGRRIVPIEFGGSLEWKDGSSRLAPLLPVEMLRIREPAAALASGPSAETVATIRRTFNLVRQDKKRLRVFAVIALVLAVLSVAAITAAVVAVLQKNRAESTLAAATVSADKLVRDIAGNLRNASGLPLDDVRRLLGRAGDMLDELYRYNAGSSQLVRSKAMFLRESSQTLLQHGDAEQARAEAERSLALLAPLLAGNKPDNRLRDELSLTYNRLADALLGLGRSKDALDYYNRALDLRKDIAHADPSPQAQEALALSLERTGDLMFPTDVPHASEFYRNSFDIRTALAKAAPTDASRRLLLANSYERQARVASAGGEDPLPSYREALRIREALRPSLAADLGFLEGLGNTYDAIGAILADTACPAALEPLHSAAGIRRTLVQKTPDRPNRQANLAVTLQRLAGCGDGAHDNLVEADAIFTRLAGAGKLSAELKPLHDDIRQRLRDMPAPPGGRQP